MCSLPDRPLIIHHILHVHADMRAFSWVLASLIVWGYFTFKSILIFGELSHPVFLLFSFFS